MSDSVVIIGAGLSGLECGYILSGAGYRVTVLEKGAQPGGCLQCFTRLGRKFDTGFHYVGGLDEGESLHDIAKYFGLLELPWRRLDPSCSDKVYIGEDSFALASGYKAFADSLTSRFPHQADNIRAYVSTLKAVGDNILAPFMSDETKIGEMFSQSAYEFMQKTITDPLLRKVLSGTSLKMNLDAETLPLYVFAQITSSYVQSAWRLDGGGEQIADRLVRGIESSGGRIMCSCEVVRLNEESGRITSVMLSDGTQVDADWVISSLHPTATMSLFPESSSLRKTYRKRMSSLRSSFGMFTANICLKKGAVRYQNSSVFVHREDADLWRPDTCRTESVMIHFYPSGDGEFCDRLDILSPMSFDLVESWADCPVGRRGPEYGQIKRRKAEECIALASGAVEGLEDAIEAVFTSTPLTYGDYVGTDRGSAYGVMKDFNSAMTTVLSPRTPFGNLLLTGQSLNLHGILGVSMTSLLTCSCILGMEYIRKEVLSR